MVLLGSRVGDIFSHRPASLPYMKRVGIGATDGLTNGKPESVCSFLDAALHDIGASSAMSFSRPDPDCTSVLVYVQQAAVGGSCYAEIMGEQTIDGAGLRAFVTNALDLKLKGRSEHYNMIITQLRWVHGGKHMPWN